MILVMQMKENITKDNSQIISKIKSILNELRPFLINDGGDIEFIKFEDGIVYIKLFGACADCQMLDLTLKDGIETALKDEIPEVESVINVDTSMNYDDIF
jgi:Fe-S cluster biogenesis protein NfuA